PLSTTHLSTILAISSSNAPATTEIYTLSLHDALPIFAQLRACPRYSPWKRGIIFGTLVVPPESWNSSTSRGPIVTAFTRSRALTDRKSTRLNSSHRTISYAVFCLKKKKYNRRGWHLRI